MTDSPKRRLLGDLSPELEEAVDRVLADARPAAAGRGTREGEATADPDPR